MRGIRRVLRQKSAWAVLLLLVFSMAVVGCGNRDDGGIIEQCDNGVDDNGNDLVDCDDSQCFAAPHCESRQEHCYNLVDDDGDGDTDCDDSDCDSTVVCLDRAENCINNVDDDANGDRDCDDGACENTATCLVGAENCTNGLDDDGDGQVDCDDSDCAETAVCVTRGEICDNGKDEDSDGDVDCDDSDCAGTSICLGDAGEVCTNGEDDDGDGLIDCRDLDCAYTSACLGLGEDCGNGIDDDANGVADCQDDYCEGAPECVSPPEDCDDGVDNDGDGLSDCEDDKCSSTAFCVEFYEDCQDGEDDDGDGQVDCEDPDCEFTWVCLGRIEDCENGQDDDNDGDTDCEDIDCANTSFCVDPVEDCQNGTDDDGDGDVDCDDTDCQFTSVCLTRGEDCGNGSDDDGDGDVDCADSDCSNTSDCSTPLEDCSDGVDNDGDGAVDCDDTNCESTSACLSQGEDCLDQVDNDGDGDVDCADSDCSNTSQCVAPVEDCNDGVDNDADGDADCADADCQSTTACLSRVEDCQNTVDDDGDGDVDCADSDCANTAFCVPAVEDCSNGSDDDGDGDVDCADTDCEFTSVCVPAVEDCSNGSDDDGDGDVDCADADCANTSVCTPVVEDCSNGTDDDGDGAADCADSDCEFTSVCVASAEDCTNGTDDDGDGAADCADSDCTNTTFCATPVEDCTNGTDDDGDGDADCADADCVNTTFCATLVEDCTNGTDDDGDGAADCADSDCTNTTFCATFAEDCTNGTDDDGDGATDCADSDCEFTSFCVPVAEDCTNSTDDDGDGAADCADSDCTNTTFCATPVEGCTNGVDDDGDGATDCADTDCEFTSLCVAAAEDCTNGTDDDGDGAADCADSDCEFTTFCATFAEDCTNGTDDDGDGAVDCADSDCEFTSYCVPVAEDCTNGTDDDGDGAADCADSDCANTTFCVTPVEDCTNGTDDDGDGAADCADTDCEFTDVCLTNGEDCTNGTDDDGDGATDCADADCSSTSACIEDCSNGVDDDGDGSVDCNDASCEFTELCVPKAEECTNGTDDDLDGAIDCADTDCDSEPTCAVYQLSVLPPPPSGEPTRTFYTSVNGKVGPVAIEVTDANTLKKLEGVPLTVTSTNGVILQDTVVTNGMGIASLDIRASLAPGQYTFTVTAPDSTTSVDVVAEASPAGSGLSVPLVNVSGVPGDSTTTRPGLDAPVGSVGGAAVDAGGVMYFADKDNHRIRRLAPTGVLDVVAGSGTAGYSGDGGAATSARLNAPSTVAYDGSRNWLIIADAGNGVLRYIDLSTGVIDTLTSASSSSSSGPIGSTTAALDVYVGAVNYMTVDGTGNIYFSGGQTAGVMRLFDSSGTLSIRQVLTETACTAGDAVFVESCGTNGCPLDYSSESGIDLHVAGRLCGDEVPGGSANGVMFQNFGKFYFLAAGDGSATALPASGADYEFPQIDDIALDEAENLFVLEGNRIARLDPASVRVRGEAGAISTGYNYDYVDFASVRLDSPSYIEFDGAGSLLVSGGTMNTLVRLEGMGRSTNDPVALTANTPSNGTPLLNQGVTPSVVLQDTAGNAVETGWVSFASELGNGVADSTWLRTDGTGTASGTSWVSMAPGYYSFRAQAYDLYYRQLDTAEVFYDAVWPTTPSLFSAVNIDGAVGLSSTEPAVKAPLSQPHAVTVGSNGRVFFTEVGNSTVMELRGDGMVTRIAGNGAFGDAGAGDNATSTPMNMPSDLYYDERQDYLYIAESGSERILGIDLTAGKNALIEVVAGRTGLTTKPSSTQEDAKTIGLGEVFSIDGIYKQGKNGMTPHIYVVGSNTDGIAEIEVADPAAPDASALIRSYLPQISDCTGAVTLTVCGKDCRVSVTSEALFAFGRFCSETLGQFTGIASYDEVAAQWRRAAGAPTGSNDATSIPADGYVFTSAVGEIEATDSSVYGPAVFFTETGLGVTRYVDLVDARVNIAAGVYNASGYSGEYRLPTKSELSEPTGVHYDDARDHLWIGDTSNHRLRIAGPSGVAPQLR